MPQIECDGCSVYGLMCHQESKGSRILSTRFPQIALGKVAESIMDCSISDDPKRVDTDGLLELLYEMDSTHVGIQLQQVIDTIQSEIDDYEESDYDRANVLTAEDSVDAVINVLGLPYFAGFIDMKKSLMVSENNDEYDQRGIDIRAPLSRQAQFFLRKDEVAIQVKSSPDQVLKFFKEIAKKHANNKNYVNPFDRPLVVCCGQYGFNQLAAQISIQFLANADLRNPEYAKGVLDILDPELLSLMHSSLARIEMEREMLDILTNFYKMAQQFSRKMRKQTKRNTNPPEAKAAQLIGNLQNSLTHLPIMHSGSTSRFAVGRL